MNMHIVTLKQKLIPYLAFSLVLLAPFVNFITFNDYAFWRPEVLVIMLILVLLGVGIAIGYSWLGNLGKLVLTTAVLVVALSFFPPWRTLPILIPVVLLVLLLNMLFAKHICTLLATVAGVFILGILLLPMSQKTDQPVKWQHAVGKTNTKLPPIVYLILDEHGGVGAIPQDTPRGVQLKQSLILFYQQEKFRLYGNVYSHYPNTYNSIPNLLNFTTLAMDNAYFHVSDNRQLEQNYFFSLLAKKGYQFRIYQPGDYLDYCKVPGVPVASCYSAPTVSAGLLQLTTTSWLSRLRFLWSTYLLRSPLYQLFLYPVYKAQVFLHDHGFARFNSQWDEVHDVSHLPMLTTFAQLRNDIAQHNDAGTVFFAHILAPHGPYAYNADCQLLPIDQWRQRHVLMPFIQTTPAIREQVYAAYEGQVSCVQSQLQLLFAAMRTAGIYDQAIIIIHGDHGSRIALHVPEAANSAVLTQQDFSDFYQTLFAVKAPDYAVGYDQHFFDLQTLLADVTHSITREKIRVPHAAPYVFLLPPAVGLPLQKVAITPFHG